MVGTGTDNTNADAVALVPAGVTIDNIDAVASVEIVDSTLTVDAPNLIGSLVMMSYTWSRGGGNDEPRGNSKRAKPPGEKKKKKKVCRRQEWAEYVVVASNA
jgi:hypothetical protein